MKRTSVTLPESTFDKLTELSTILNIPASNVVMWAIDRLHTRKDEIEQLVRKDNAPIKLKEIQRNS